MTRFAIPGVILVLAAVAVVAVVIAGDGMDADGTAGSDMAGGSVEVPFDTSSWDTDFGQHKVDLDEFVSGGPPKDGIPSIDDPQFVSVEEAAEFVAEREPVAVVEVEGDVRAYPLQILTWHEIVNDRIGGEPVAVTYCPLCNSTVVFSREIGGEPVEFGTTGKLRKSDLVMYDRRTESWWQQLSAEAVVGELTGTKLELIPSQILSFEDLARLHPEARVLSRDTGHSRNYGSNPYAAYDDPESEPFLLDEEPDRSLPPKERVAAVKTGGRSAVVYPFSRLAEEAPINDEIDGKPVVVMFDPEVASALDEREIASGRDVGTAAVFDRRFGGRTLDLRPGPEAGTFRDVQTGSEWSMRGRATVGELEGAQLEQLVHDDQFWFALAAFFEDAEIRK